MVIRSVPRPVAMMPLGTAERASRFVQACKRAEDSVVFTGLTELVADTYLVVATPDRKTCSVAITVQLVPDCPIPKMDMTPGIADAVAQLSARVGRLYPGYDVLPWAGVIAPIHPKG